MNDVEDPYGLEQMTRDHPEILVMRQSTIGQIDVCGLRQAFGEDAYRRHEYHTNSARAVGTAYHGGLEHWYQACHGRVTADEDSFRDVLLAAHEAYNAEVARAERAGTTILAGDETHDTNKDQVDDMLTAYFDGNHQHDPDVWEVKDVELTFWAPFSDTVVIRSTPDLILQSRAYPNSLRIADHKTCKSMWPPGKESARKHIQPGFYIAHGKPVLADRYGIDPALVTIDWTFDIMSYAGKFDRRRVNVMAHHEQMARIRTTMAAAAIQRKVLLPNPTSNLCSVKYCDAWEICPFGNGYDPEADPF